MRHRIATFNLNDTRRDPRVQRISQTLVMEGHEICVFEMRSGDLAPQESVEGLAIRRVPVPTDYSREAMSEFARLCPTAAEILRRCDPMVMEHPGTGRFRLRLRLLKEMVAHHKAQLLGGEVPCVFDLRNEIAAIRSILLINLELYKHGVQYRPTLLYCNDLDTLLAGYMLKTNLQIPLIYDAHEIYPEQLAEHMRSETWHGFYTNLERMLVGHSDGRLTVCDSLANYFSEHYNVPGFVTIRNVPSVRYLPDPAILDRKPRRRKLLYHGSYAAYRGLDEIIKAVPQIENADVIFRGIGSYLTTLRKLAAEYGVSDRVQFMPAVSLDELVSTASDCDVGLNPFINVCKNTEFALPNKFFEYMMGGLAIASSDLIEMRRLTQALDVGILFDDLTPAAIARALNEFVARPNEIDRCRARAYYAAKTRFNWEHEGERLLSFFQQFA